MRQELADKLNALERRERIKIFAQIAIVLVAVAPLILFNEFNLDLADEGEALRARVLQIRNAQSEWSAMDVHLLVELDDGTVANIYLTGQLPPPAVGTIVQVKKRHRLLLGDRYRLIK